MERLRIEVVGDTVVAVGEVDPTTTHQLVEATEMCSGDVRIDLAGCTFMDSTGLTTLIQIDNAAQAVGGTLTLVNPSKQVHRLLELCGMIEVFAFETGECPVE